MIESNRLPTFNNEGKPTHWLAPARNHTPVISQNVKNRYTQEAVIENRSKNLTDYESEAKGKSIKRHYIQESAVTENKVKTLIDRLNIPTGSNWLLFAGYTGELADVLSTNLGCSVIFTDPLKTWVEKAANNGLTADQYTIQDIPGDHFKQIDGVGTFEGYEAISNDLDLLYEGMRCLTTKHGLTFFQSKFTRNCTKSTGNGKSIKGRFKAFEKSYDVTSCYRENDGLRAYNMRANTVETRAKILADYLTFYSIADLYFSEEDIIKTNDGRIQITPNLLSTISDILQIPYQQAKESYNRIEEVNYHMQSQNEKTYAQRWMLGFPMGNQVIMIQK